MQEIREISDMKKELKTIFLRTLGEFSKIFRDVKWYKGIFLVIMRFFRNILEKYWYFGGMKRYKSNYSLMWGYFERN